MQFFKKLHKDKANENIFSKELCIKEKPEPGHYNYDKNLDSTYKHGEDVALRRKAHNSRGDVKAATLTSDKMPSSITDQLDSSKEGKSTVAAVQR